MSGKASAPRDNPGKMVVPARILLTNSTPIIKVNHRGAARLRAGHVWVYRSDLVPPTDAPAGSLVHVRDERGRRLGSALYSSSSQIAIRLISTDDIAEGALPELVRQRIANAVEFRRRLARDTDSYRVIFSEADLLPGLIVDKYNDVLSLQALTQAFDRDDLRQVVQESLAAAFPDASLLERVDPHIRELEQLPPRIADSRDIARAGVARRRRRDKTIFTLNGVQFHFDGLGGQKTGAFLDQRENYAAAARYAHGAALDCFTYQGGFALHLARVCDNVAAVDSSRPALEVAEQNEQLNRAQHRGGEIEWIEANASIC